MTVRVYRSSNYNAIKSRGEKGRNTNILDACLVDGFGDQTVTITSTGGVATITCSFQHGIKGGAYYTISGANESEYNGEFFTTVTSDSTLTYDISGTPASPATGTITGRHGPAGWAKEVESLNVNKYKQPSGNNRAFRCDDNFSTVYSKIIGMESFSESGNIMPPANGAFPITAPLFYLIKSTDTGSDREWRMIVTDTSILFDTEISSTTVKSTLYFGDIESSLSNDTSYNTIIICEISSANSSVFEFASASINPSINLTGHYVLKGYTQVGGTAQGGKGSFTVGSSTLFGTAGYGYPYPLDGSVRMSKIKWYDSGVIRGVIPGLWSPLHDKPFANGDHFYGTGDGAGKLFEVFYYNNSSQLVMEISDTF